MRKKLIWLLFLSALFLITSCMDGWGLLDVMGLEEQVTEKEKKEKKETIEDDKIEDKHPEYDASRVVAESFEDCVVMLNKSKSITKLDILPFEGSDEELKDKVFKNRFDIISDLENRQNSERTLIPSLETVNGSLKPFNDGLYASIELGVQNGLTVDNNTVFPSKKLFLQELFAALLKLVDSAPENGKAFVKDGASEIAAAILISGETLSAPADILDAALLKKSNFVALFAKPIGFYSWNKELSSIFSQDRFLQNNTLERDAYPFTEQEIGKAAAIFLAIKNDESLKTRYEKYLSLYAGLTNPFSGIPVSALESYVKTASDLDKVAGITELFMGDFDKSLCPHRIALFPPSNSKESQFFEEAFCGTPTETKNLNYLDFLIAAIKDGSLNLAPDKNSGWYDYQSYALEILLLPEKAEEKDHIFLTKAYKEKLVETFKTIMIQNRETHAKQLGMSSSKSSGVSSRTIDLYPLLKAEPFPTFYLRTARAYRFLSTYLDAVLGSDFMGSAKRLNEDGLFSEISIKEELLGKIRLLYGLYSLTSDSLGSKPQLLQDELAEFAEKDSREKALEWLGVWRNDADMLKDFRVIVPVQIDYNTEEIVYWAVLGAKAYKLKAEFYKGFEPEVVSSDYCEIESIIPHEYYIMSEVSSEIRRPLDAPPLNRDEFRGICNKYDSVDEIVKAVEKF